ncbi:MAG: hypothetical protein IJM68_01130 [Synergistaceae bacterium]|nr:hypothetical protein [Synergistaceae bacterium]
MKNKTKKVMFDGRNRLSGKQTTELLAMCKASAGYRVDGPRDWIDNDDGAYNGTQACVESILPDSAYFWLQTTSDNFSDGAVIFGDIDKTIECWLRGMGFEPIFQPRREVSKKSILS